MNKFTINVIRGNGCGYEYLNGDVCTDSLTLLDSIGQIKYRTGYCTSKPTLRMPDGTNELAIRGIIANGNYKAIYTINDQVGYHWVLFNPANIPAGVVITNINQLTEAMMTFPSIVFNKSDDGMYLTEVMIHNADDVQGNYSEGCVTVKRSEWGRFINTAGCLVGDMADVIISGEWKQSA